MISEFDTLVWNAVDTISPPSGFDRYQWFSFINAIIEQESHFRAELVSYTGKGIGLMQINPDWWLTYFNVSRESLFDPYTNIIIGAQIIKDYVTKYGTSGGLGAYFAGPAKRLTDGVRYAQEVLGRYSNFISKVKAMFQTAPAQPGMFYFVDPGTQETFTTQNDYLPETGTIPSNQTAPEDLALGLTFNDEDLYNLYIIGGALILGYVVSES